MSKLSKGRLKPGALSIANSLVQGLLASSAWLKRSGVQKLLEKSWVWMEVHGARSRLGTKGPPLPLEEESIFSMQTVKKTSKEGSLLESE
jgi:hypothetical protein